MSNTPYVPSAASLDSGARQGADGVGDPSGSADGPAPYRLEYSDLLALNVYLFTHSLRAAVVFVLMTFAVPAVLAYNFFHTLGYAVLWSVLFMPLLIVMGPLQRSKSDMTVKLTADGLESATALARSQWRWAAFHEAAVTKKRLFLFLKMRRNVAVAVPRRAFPGDAEWQSFVAACEDGIARAKAEEG